MAGDQRLEVIAYDKQAKAFTVTWGDIAFEVPSPYQKVEKHFLSGLVSTLAFQHVKAWRGRVEINGITIIRDTPGLLDQMRGAIDSYMTSRASIKIETLILSNGGPATVRCVSLQPPAFEFESADLVVTLSLYKDENLRVIAARRSGNGGDALPLGRDVVNRNGKAIYSACLRLWTEELGLSQSMVFAG
jgi:hypothetical protein